MKKTIKYLVMAVSILYMYACGDSDLNHPMGSTIVPAQIEVKNIKNLNGKSVIFFNRPDDKNFKYLKVVYQTDTEKRSTNVSYYTDSITVEGFGAAGEYAVNLYSVSAGEAYSEPVVIKVNPLNPPFLFAYESLKVLPTFGGIRIIANNINGEMLTFYAYKKNTKGEWNETGALYTTAEKISQSIRGIEAEEAEFGVVIKDRWGHRSEMLTTTLTPWYEEMCDKKKIGFLKIDSWESHTQPISVLWDGITTDWNKTFMNKLYYTDKSTQITIDLGRKYKLSRMELHGRKTATNFTSIFTNLYPKTIEVWGRNDDQTTGFDENDPSWTKILSTVIKRADGTTADQDLVPLINADREIAIRGSEAIFFDDILPTRYVCFRSIVNYGNRSSRFNLNELTFYGTPVE